MEFTSLDAPLGIKYLNKDHTESISAPAARNMSCPCSAGPLEPETGASRKSAPASRTASPISTEVALHTVEASMYALPAEIAPVCQQVVTATYVRAIASMYHS